MNKNRENKIYRIIVSEELYKYLCIQKILLHNIGTMKEFVEEILINQLPSKEILDIEFKKLQEKLN